MLVSPLFADDLKKNDAKVAIRKSCHKRKL
jgi:hypothetical protein